jgi:hypothetical protein
VNLFRLINDAVRQRAADYVMQAPEGWACVFMPWEEARSHEQNAAYWSWITEVCDAGVQDSDGRPFDRIRLHTTLKRKFLGKFIRIMPNGDTDELEATTTRLKRKEFSDYMTRCQAWITENA